MDKAITKLESDLSGLEGKLTDPINQVIEFVKDHKKILIVLGITYLVYRYLFSDED